ncbi:hypothetical protein Dimus_038048 [Dionaea muscipula]
MRNMNLRIGNGESIRFWHDQWFGDCPLKLVFPRLFVAASDGDVALAKCISGGPSGRAWSLNFQVSLGPRSREFLNGLLVLIGRPPGSNNDMDNLIWMGGQGGDLSVKLLYNWISGSPRRRMNGLEVVWNKVIPPRIQVFGWTIWHDRVKTLVGLQERGIRVDNVICIFCGFEEESIDHVFLHCLVVWKIWANCFSGGVFVGGACLCS